MRTHYYIVDHITGVASAKGLGSLLRSLRSKALSLTMMSLMGIFTLSLTGCSSHSDADHDHEHDHSEEVEHGHTHDHEDEDHDHEGHDHSEHAHEADHDHDHDHGTEAAQDEHAHAKGEIILAPEVAAQMGVVTEVVQMEPFAEVLKAVGRFERSTQGENAVYAPTSGIVKLTPNLAVGEDISRGKVIATISSSNISGGNPNAAVHAEVEAAQKELDRITPLYEARIITAKEYNEAVQRLAVAKAAHSEQACSGRAVSNLSGQIQSIDVTDGQYVETGQVIAVIGSLDNIIMRVDVPSNKAAFLRNTTGGRVVTLDGDGTYTFAQLNAKAAGTKPVRANGGFSSVNYIVANPGQVFIPGEMVDVYLLGNEGKEALTVQESAIIEQQGNFYCYVKVGDDAYLKRRVTLGRRDGQKVEILSGLNPGENVVQKGATVVKLAETSTVAPEGHHHH